ncbi:hypothetical protein QFC19_001665 [Naganishia cerealis]|uniref:Uncharacterized protein n=1 Tax=Naganishia cerealis TaxID=610337 RepID=A0ACC2WGS4_9TREE|nr:hypothetical protein QFC19_001665 [Naganishia cerealis]
MKLHPKFLSFPGQPVSTAHSRAGEMQQGQSGTEEADRTGLQPHISPQRAQRHSAGTTGSLASSQTIRRCSPLPETSRETVMQKVDIKDEISQKTSEGKSWDGEAEIHEKRTDGKEVIELDDGLVYLGTDKETGKAIIKSKQQVSGGPYSQPKW